jgi:hypothetical protein
VTSFPTTPGGARGARVPASKGVTAARLAGAIASGRAVNHETLASSAHVGYDTAAKLVDYLGPLIRDRGEHSPELKMTPEVVYRWCGEHARYILGWCRRNGYADIATRVMPADRAESSAGAAVDP